MTPENLARLEGITGVLDAESVDLEDILRFNWAHHEGKLRLRTLAQAHRAIVGGSPENGVIVQFKYHSEDDCRLCLRKKRERAKNAPPIASLRATRPGQSIPRPPDDGKSLWTFKPDGDGGWNRVLRRKPETVTERQELISQRGTLGANGKPVKWEYFAKHLAQVRCQKCRGKDLGCPCVTNEEML